MTSASSPPSTSSPPCRRWFRFSLRSLLVLMAVVAVPLAWKFNQVRAQQRVIAAVEAAGGELIFDYQVEWFLAGRTGTAEPPGPGWLRRVLGNEFAAEVVDVKLLTGGNHDRLMELVATLPKVRMVEATGVSDVGLAHLAKSPSLISLEVSGEITDAGTLALSQFPRLQQLFLSSPRLTDAGVASLAQHRALLVIRLDGEQISASAVTGLEHARPDCQVSFINAIDGSLPAVAVPGRAKP